MSDRTTDHRSLSTVPDTLVEWAGAAKALDDAGKFGGHLVRWGDPEHTDISEYRDYFDASTDYWKAFPAEVPVIYNHGRDATLGLRRLGTAAVKADDAGLWLEGQLALRDGYERKVFELVKAGKLGLSSGSAAHLVRREKQSNDSNKIVSWYLAEASLTPTPAEPRILVHALKSLAGDDAAPAESLDEALAKLASDAGGFVPVVERQMRNRLDAGRPLSADRIAALKALSDAFGRLLHAATAPERHAAARKALGRERLALALSELTR